ncbi:MAG: CpsD/CapB family tyrosine-protein kinase [Nitrospira sp.]|nr:MAG: CpsD/CapB family tyrosine-protein kinase [Nitrospira sp.]
MERLQLALSRYRDQQRTRESSHKPVPPVPPSVLGRERPIVYTKTRTVQIQAEILREQRILSAFQEGPFVDAFKMLRTQVMHRLKENGWNVLAVTSPGSGEGKTFTAINLAIALALDVTQTVLLVDADLRDPSVDRTFGIEGVKGLADYLFDHVPLEDLLIHPSIGRFVLLPGGRRVPNSSEALTSPRMTALVHELKHRYPSRVIVFDLPPILQAADVLAFAPYTDAALLIVEEGQTKREEVERALQLLKGATPVIGTVLNKSSELGRVMKKHGESQFEERRAPELTSGQPGNAPDRAQSAPGFLKRRKAVPIT